MNIIADGLEQQRDMLDIDYYPDIGGKFINYWTGKIDKMSWDEAYNYHLNEGARKAVYLLQEASAPGGTIKGIQTVVDNSGACNECDDKDPYILGTDPIPVDPYHGPAMVTGLLPEDGSSVNSPVTLSWDSDAGANSYNVYLAEGNDSELRLAYPDSSLYQGSTSSTSWKLLELESGRDKWNPQR
jgi:hypothetical protein